MTTEMIPEQILKARECRVVGIMGRAGSGKTTVAQRLVDQHPRSARFSFARPIRMMLQALIDSTRPKTHPYTATDYTDDPKLKNTPIPFLMNQTPRRLMQTLGTEWARNTVDRDFWVEIARGKVERKLGTYWLRDRPRSMAVIFDDVRFANEVEMIRSFGGVVLKVVRPDQEIISEAAHASEQLDVEADITVVNDGTVMDLWRKIDIIWPSGRAPETTKMRPRIS
jgi:hypothetical protein